MLFIITIILILEENCILNGCLKFIISLQIVYGFQNRRLFIIAIQVIRSPIRFQKMNKKIEIWHKQVYQRTLMLIQKKLDICFSTMIRGIDMLTFIYPKDQLAMKFAIITLEQYYSELITQLVMNQKAPQTLFYRPHTFDLQKTIKVELTPKKNLLKMYSLTEEVIFYLKYKTKVPEQIFNKLCKIVFDYKNPHNELESYQFVFLLVLYCQYFVHTLGFGQDSILDHLIRCENICFTKKISQIYQEFIVYKSTLLIEIYQKLLPEIQPDNVALLKPYINSVIIKRSSVIKQGLIENRHNLQLKRNTIVLDDYYFCPRSSVIFLISKKLSNELNTITSLRRASFDEYHFDQLCPYEYEDHFKNLSIYLYSKLKVTQNLQSRKNISLIIVDDWNNKQALR